MSQVLGLDVSDQVSMAGDLELAVSNSQVRLRNLGEDYASGLGYSILTWMSYAQKNADFNINASLVAHERGATSIVGGKLDAATADGWLYYDVPEDLDLGYSTWILRFTPGWNGDNPGVLRWLAGLTSMQRYSQNEFAFYIHTDGTLHAILYNATGANIANVSATAIEVNGAGLTWNTTEEVYVAICVDAVSNTLKMYAGRVSDGTTNICKTDPNITGVARNNTAGKYCVGGIRHTTTEYYSDIFVAEFAILAGPISSAASFPIPAVINKVYATDSPEVVFTEIDLEGSRTVDMSALNILNLTRLDSAGDCDLEYKYSCHNTSGSPDWSVGWNPLVDLQAESDPTGKYFQLKAQVNASLGTGTDGLADTGDFLTVGDAAVDVPDAPLSLAWTDNADGTGGSLALTIDAVATLTTIQYRKVGSIAYSETTTTDTGAATKAIAITDLGMYEFRAYSIDASSYNSAPSATIRGQVTDGTAATPTNMMVFERGELIVYRPRVGGTRKIKGVVNRDEPESFPGASQGMGPSFQIWVDNDATTGIATGEIDTGGDKIDVARLKGGALIRRNISMVIPVDVDITGFQVR